MVQYIHFSGGGRNRAVAALKGSRQVAVITQERDLVVLHYPTDELDIFEKYKCFVPSGSYCAYHVVGELKGNEEMEEVRNILEDYLKRKLEEDIISIHSF